MQAECPNCHTLFRVTEAQLDMAEGMVRCGFCKHVFNARAKDDVSADEPGPVQSATDLSNNDLAPAAGTPATQTDIDSLASDDYASLTAADPYALGSTRSYSTAATVAWSLAILSLIALLAAEFIWFNHPELLQGQGYQPLTQKLCAVTDCTHMQKRDPSQIEMISRNVYTHPNEKHALMVSTTLVNNASYAQPYPDVQIDFSNVRGRLIASRRFRPEEYLQVDEDQIGLLGSGTQIAFALEISDPGREAITYEFSFH